MQSPATNIYESNLALLEKHHNPLFKRITQNPPEPLGEIFYAPNGKPNLRVMTEKGVQVTLHNEIDPEAESKEFAQNLPGDFKGFAAILGMGLGYGALRILKERPLLQRLAFFELEPGIFVQALRHVDLTSILDDPRLILGIGPTPEIPVVLETSSRTIQLESSSVLHHKPSFTLHPDSYKQLEEDLFSYINSLNIGGATIRSLGRDFFDNRFKNIATIHHHLMLEGLQSKFEGIPAILVAGGPSLNRNIQQLKQMEENAVIIAVDTVLPALIDEGVSPHFTTCIDPLDLTYEKFADIAPKAKDTALICASWVTAKTPKIFPAAQVFWTFSGKPIEAWLNTTIGGKIFTGGASTVAHLNLIAAHILGCDPIIFIGQDLAYSDADSASHAKGTILQGADPTARIKNPIKGETVIGINGETLRTDRAFLSMKKYFETAIAASDRTHINATAWGANIEGTQILNLEDAIGMHCSKKVYPDRILQDHCSAAPPMNADGLTQVFDRMLAKTRKLQKLIKKSDAATAALLKEIQKLKKQKAKISSFSMLSTAQNKKIQIIDKCHQELDDTTDVWAILEEITMEGLKESERRKQAISILEKDSDTFHDWLIKSLNQRLLINQTRKQTLAIFANNLNMVITFLQKERKYLKQDELKLAGLYMKHGNYHMAKPLLKKLQKKMPDSPEINVHLGCIAMQFNLYEEANRYFQRAVRANPKLARTVNAHLKAFGDEFLDYATYFKTEPGRELSVKYMVQKGLKYTPDHDGLKKELEAILASDLDAICEEQDKGNFESQAALTEEWHNYVTDQNKVFTTFPPAIIGRLHLCFGKLKCHQKNYLDAVDAFDRAIEYQPDNRDNYSAKIEALFMAGEFGRGIDALNSAVKKDSTLASYWETIGDSLQDGGQYDDAILAYEKCFIHLPDNMNLLKKIGDCYMETNQLEAAKAAYTRLKEHLQSSGEA
ncbi:MAG: DUF115 domain-containing protein [Desulfobacter sp.]|nr:MAG: DUF115 domain-containing protein [Desulfobacter sp.]